MDAREAYATLGLPNDASWEHVRQAYRSQLRRFHPDTSRGVGNPRALQSVRAAYRQLRTQHLSATAPGRDATRDESRGRVDLYA
jgi:curved DNA-binding protein CbpA